MRATHDVCQKLRRTDVSSEYVRVLASDWTDSVVHTQFRRADAPCPVEEPAYRHGDFGTALREGDLWEAFCRADSYHTEVLLDVFDPVEIVLCTRHPKEARKRIADSAERHDLLDGLPEWVTDENVYE